MWDLIVSVPDHCLFFTLHKALMSVLVLDDLSLAWPAVVQQEVSFNSGSQ